MSTIPPKKKSGDMCGIFAETHAGELKDSLAEEVEDVQKEVTAVSLQREEAKRKLTALEKEMEALNEQRQELKVGSSKGSLMKVVIAKSMA